MRLPDRRSYWREAFSLHGSVTPYVMPLVLTFGILATGICSLSWLTEYIIGHRLALEEAPYEIAGAVLGLLLVFRTNAGYDRWWEGRKLWGGIVNQSRNLVISGLAYGPADLSWRKRFVAWAAVFPHVARNSLRGDAVPAEVAELVGPAGMREMSQAQHMPNFASMKVALLVREAVERHHMDGFAMMRIDEQRAGLIDHIGACERILKTPVPRVYAIKVRQFITLFLLTLPFALLHRLETDWLIPLITMLVAYPLVALDQISIELQNPFNNLNLSPLPLEDISNAITQNLISLEKQPAGSDSDLDAALAGGGKWELGKAAIAAAAATAQASSGI
ncbi:MAG TPA: bestrophin family ion channel [Caulifigura sp.]|jgi:putative membrane protein|nr:bestrophin family ion channel [Caulifigura sp.]